MERKHTKQCQQINVTGKYVQLTSQQMSNLLVHKECLEIRAGGICTINIILGLRNTCLQTLGQLLLPTALSINLGDLRGGGLLVPSGPVQESFKCPTRQMTKAFLK